MQGAKKVLATALGLLGDFKAHALLTVMRSPFAVILDDLVDVRPCLLVFCCEVWWAS